MYDWLDDVRYNLILTYPSLRNFIDQAIDMGDHEQLLNFLMALESDQIH